MTNGDTGRGYPAAAAWEIAGRNISWPIARDALQQLTAAHNGGLRRSRVQLSLDSWDLWAE